MATGAVSANRLEILQIANAVAAEKNIDKRIVLEAMEEAIQKAARSRYGLEHDIRAEINPDSGETRLWPACRRAVHTRLAWTPAERWHIGLEGQYVDTNWGNFTDERGHFERGGVIVEYMISERLGVHVGYDWFRLRLADDYRGSFEAPAESGVGTVDYSGKLTGQLKTHGPMAGLTFRF